MKIEIYLPEPSLQNEVIQALSDAQLTDKVELNVLPDPSQQKSKQRKKPTIVPVRTCHVDRGTNGKLWCMACGQKLPATPEGELDTAQLEYEIVTHRRWPEMK